MITKIKILKKKPHHLRLSRLAWTIHIPSSRGRDVRLLWEDQHKVYWTVRRYPFVWCVSFFLDSLPTEDGTTCEKHLLIQAVPFGERFPILNNINHISLTASSYCLVFGSCLMTETDLWDKHITEETILCILPNQSTNHPEEILDY